MASASPTRASSGACRTTPESVSLKGSEAVDVGCLTTSFRLGPVHILREGSPHHLAGWCPSRRAQLCASGCTMTPHRLAGRRHESRCQRMITATSPTAPELGRRAGTARHSPLLPVWVVVAPLHLQYSGRRDRSAQAPATAEGDEPVQAQYTRQKGRPESGTYSTQKDPPASFRVLRKGCLWVGTTRSRS
jgi:hypothetical protein